MFGIIKSYSIRFPYAIGRDLGHYPAAGRRPEHAPLFETTSAYVNGHAWPPMPFLEPLSAKC